MGSNGTTRLLILRHGEVAEEAKQILYGQMDVALSPLGVQQSEEVAQRLSDEQIAAVYSSDLERAHYLARCIAERHRLEPQTTPLLRERDFGQWQGLAFEELRQNHGDQLEAYFRHHPEYVVPGAESFDDIWRRVEPWYREILSRHQGQTVAIAVHSGITRLFLADAIGLTFRQMFRFEQKFCCLNIIEVSPEKTLVRLING